MSSEVITRNDLKAVLDEVLPPERKTIYTLLWENPSTSGGMGTATIQIDATDCDLIQVIFWESSQSGRNYEMSQTISAPKGSATVYGKLEAYSVASGSYTTVMHRTFTVTATSISFSVGYWRGTNETALYAANDPCIPLRVYKIKAGTE